MRVWWEVARRGFARYATYRWATFGGVFTNTIFGLMRASIFVALFKVAGSVGGYNISDAITYTFLAQAMLMPLYIWGWQEIADTVMSGQVVTDLYRPIDYQLYWLAQDLGRATYHFFMRGFPPFFIGAIFFDLRLPTRPETVVFFVVSVYAAVTISFALRFMVNLSAFWIVNVRGVQGISATAWTLLSGATIPIAFFPEAIGDAIRLLPFVGMLEIPVDVFLERVTGAEAVGAVAFQLVWAFVLLLAGRSILGAGTRKLVIQGG